MASSFDVSQILSRFPGVAPLFPLPNVVLYPHIPLPLHIFEPRYRRMVHDALDAEGWLAMALLKPGWSLLPPATTPPVHDVVCLGRITQEQQLPDGRYWLVLQGLSRARVVEEVNSCGLPYRRARLQLECDVYPPSSECERGTHWKELLKRFRKIFPNVDLSQLVPGASGSAAPLGVLCDILAYAMKLDLATRQQLLSELNVDRRCEALLHEQASVEESPRSSAKRSFPPDFSQN